jgi:inhibitor of cysteine peptidase
VALLALLLSACGGSGETTPASQSTTEAITEQGSDQTTVYTEAQTQIDVAAGDSFTIELPINPSTGYRWQVELPMGYVQVSDEILQPEDAGDAVGQSTAERWVFSADAPGTGTIDFTLLPPGSDTPEQTVTFTVTAS